MLAIVIVLLVIIFGICFGIILSRIVRTVTVTGSAVFFAQSKALKETFHRFGVVLISRNFRHLCLCWLCSAILIGIIPIPMEISLVRVCRPTSSSSSAFLRR